MHTTAPPRSVAALDAALTWTHGRLDLARATPLEAPTPCAAWDLGRLLTHMDESLVALAEAAEVGHVPIDVVRRCEPGALVDRLVERACRTREAWVERLTSAPVSVGGLALGRDTLVLVGALEIAVHGWDVAQACGDTREIPASVAEPLLAVAWAVVPASERGRRFAECVEVAGSESAGTRLLGHLGRRT